MNWFIIRCGPCKMISPYFEQMASSKEFSNVVFVKLDVDETPDLAQRYEVSSMPTFVFLRKGKIVGRFSGASVQKLRDTIKSLL